MDSVEKEILVERKYFSIVNRKTNGKCIKLYISNPNMWEIYLSCKLKNNKELHRILTQHFYDMNKKALFTYLDRITNDLITEINK